MPPPVTRHFCFWNRTQQSFRVEAENAMYSEPAILELVGLIYDAAGDARLWSAFLEKLMGVMECAASTLFVQDLSNHEEKIVAALGFAHPAADCKARSPRVSRFTFLPCARRIYVHSLRIVLDFCLLCSIVRLYPPHMQFLFVRPGVCLRLPSDSTSRWTPLPF